MRQYDSCLVTRLKNSFPIDDSPCLKVSVYDLSVATRVAVLSGHSGPVSGVACGDDWVLSASMDSTLRLWQVRLKGVPDIVRPRLRVAVILLQESHFRTRASSIVSDKGSYRLPKHLPWATCSVPDLCQAEPGSV